MSWRTTVVIPHRAVEKDDAAPWSRPFGRRCKSQTLAENGPRRCDLTRNHDGLHRAEHGEYDIVWERAE